ncbi:MAG TPA: hypothetical protein VFN37_08560 [Candidatus Baltobacteraceae bacterium]|nr:hypothetical protein [Candidatus Baltobacteraceae bacterium]
MKVNEQLTQRGVPPRFMIKKSARSLAAAERRAGRSLVIKSKKRVVAV